MQICFRIASPNDNGNIHGAENSSVDVDAVRVEVPTAHLAILFNRGTVSLDRSAVCSPTAVLSPWESPCARGVLSLSS